MLAQSQSPGNEQRDFWSSKAADTPGSRNLSGIKDPVVDALVDRVIFATDRDDLLAATHALDRVLLWNYYVVPQWHLPKVWMAYWNKFGYPGKAAELYRRRHRIPGGSTRPRKRRCQPNTRARIERARAFHAATSWRSARAAAAAPLLPGPAFAAVPADQPLHGLSAFGDLKYGPDFTHFDYVNPDAPKGGLFNFQPPNWVFNQNTQTFNTLNFLVPSGDAPPRMEMCFDSLMVRALDEPDAVYGLLAESVSFPTIATASSSLRPEARFHDGTPLTAARRRLHLQTYKDKGHPDLALALTHMTEAVADDPATFRLTFSGKQSARTILTILEFPIVSKAFYEANPFDSSQINPPLGSGPTRSGASPPGQTIEYERVADYWGRDLP